MIVLQEDFERVKQLIGELSRLRTEMTTDKHLLTLEQMGASSLYSDLPLWSRAQQALEQPVSAFRSPWLFVECYLYRRVVHQVELLYTTLYSHSHLALRLPPPTLLIH